MDKIMISSLVYEINVLNNHVIFSLVGSIMVRNTRKVGPDII